MPSSDAIRILDKFRSWLAHLDAELVLDEDLAGLNEVFVRLYDLKTEVDLVARAAMKRATGLMGDVLGAEAVVEDGRILEIESKVSRTNWDNEALRRAVIDQSLSHLVADDDGVIDPVRAETITKVVEALLAVWSMPGYDAKKGGLKSLGLRPDDFCESTWSTAFKVRPAPTPLEIPE